MRQSWIVTPVIMGLNLTVLAMPRFALAQDMRAPLERTTLPNGLEVIVVENHSVPLAMVLVAVRTGAFTQSEGEQGLAHLFEHVLFRAYGGDPMDFASDASRMNAIYNGTTGTDVATYYLVLPSENAKDAIRLLGRLMSRSRFHARDLEEELPVVLDELARTESDPEAAFQRRLNRQLWRNDWYRRDVIGDSAALASIDLDRLVAAFKEFYIPNNAALIVTGDVDPTETFYEAAKQFEDWQTGPPPFDAGRATVALRPFSGSSGLLMSGSVLNVTVKVGLLGPGLATDARPFTLPTFCRAFSIKSIHRSDVFWLGTVRFNHSRFRITPPPLPVR